MKTIDRDKFVNALRDTQKYDYWLWPEFFVNDELQNLKQQVNSLNLEVEPEEFGAEGKKLTNSFTFEFKDISKLDSMIRLKKYITYINECHFGYSIYEYSDFDLVCYNTYDGNLKHEYKWHIDRASNLREVKLIFSTLAESFTSTKTKRSIKESYASKPSRSTAPKKEILSEGNALAARWKKLANLK